jgi:hypothetical protein
MPCSGPGHSCTSRSGTPASSAVVMNACRNVCGPTFLRTAGQAGPAGQRGSHESVNGRPWVAGPTGVQGHDAVQCNPHIHAIRCASPWRAVPTRCRLGRHPPGA